MKRLVPSLLTLIFSFFTFSAKADMPPATIYAGPEEGGKYTTAQTSLLLLWEGHSLTFRRLNPFFYVANITEGAEKSATVYECSLDSEEDGGLNAVVFNFADAGITQTRISEGVYDIVYGNFEITIPQGLVESASGEWNCEQKISFSQVPLTGGESELTSIGDDEETLFTVFSTDGKEVLKRASASDLKALPKGVYIVNGHKKVIK